MTLAFLRSSAAACAVALLLFSPQSVYAASTATPADSGQQGDAKSGRAIVEHGKGVQPEQACGACHKVTGEGDADGGTPRVAGQSEDYLLRALEEYANGIRENEVMTPIAKALKPAQRRDVAAYYASVEDSPWSPPKSADEKIISYGESLAVAGSASRGIQACANCHGPQGRGLPPSYPYLSGQHAAYLAARIKDWREKKAGEDPTPANIMAHIARLLNDQEIEAVTQYYSSLPPDPIRLGRTASGDQTP